MVLFTFLIDIDRRSPQYLDESTRKIQFTKIPGVTVTLQVYLLVSSILYTKQYQPIIS